MDGIPDAVSGAPQYKQIATQLRRRIVQGEFKEGERLPTEQALCETFNVSRMTARQAITVLVSEGLVRRERGAGAFVASSKIERDLNSTSGFYEDFASLGLDPGARVLSRERRYPTVDEQQKLMLGRLQEVVAVRRTRTVSRVPYGLQELIVPVHLVPDIESIDLETRSFYLYLRDELDLPLSHVEQHISATIDPEVSALCGIDEGIPLLRMERVSFVGRNTPIELLVSSFRADRYAYRVTMDATSAVHA